MTTLESRERADFVLNRGEGMADAEGEKTWIRQFLQRLQSHESLEAWKEFLASYSCHIFEVIRLCEKDVDDIEDCFVFICEQLKNRRFRRLRQFRPDESATFSTWLSVVVRNLARDWRRKRSGRSRPFRAVSHLSVQEQEIYHCVYEERLSLYETYWVLRPRFPHLTHELVNKSVDLISTTLSARQHWLLNFRKPKLQAIEDKEGKDSPPIQIIDSSPSPEQRAILKERQKALRRAFTQLSPKEKVILRLRYEKELTLVQIACVAGIRSPQMVDYKIQKILTRLKKLLD